MSSSTEQQATAQAPDQTLLRPAAAAPSQGRKRPLRTYGRRSGQEKAQQREAPQTTGPPADEVADARRTPSPTQPLPPVPEKEQANSRGRGSITAYFKPLPASPNPDRPSPADTRAPLLSSPSPPPTYPSPPSRSRSRKRRRLTTRPQFAPLDRQPGGRSDDLAGLIHATTDEASPCSPCSPPSTRTTTPPAKNGPADTLRLAFGRLAASTVHLQDQPADPSERRCGAMTDKPAQKRPPRDMTQTTLSLSVQKEPGFTICGVCDLLYNPLNEKDRKEHNRRHAAFSRAKRRAT